MDQSDKDNLIKAINSKIRLFAQIGNSYIPRLSFEKEGLACTESIQVPEAFGVTFEYQEADGKIKMTGAEELDQYLQDQPPSIIGQNKAVGFLKELGFPYPISVARGSVTVKMDNEKQRNIGMKFYFEESKIDWNIIAQRWQEASSQPEQPTMRLQ